MRRFLLAALLLITAVGCNASPLVPVTPVPDSGEYVLPLNDGGVIIQFDGGTTVCLPNPDCIVEDGGTCHAGFQECLPDGTLGTCQPYAGDCPTQTSGCDGGVDLFFVMDDSNGLSDAGVRNYIVAQQAVATFVFENQQSNYHYAAVDVPGCSGLWSAGTPKFLSGQAFMGFISVQCMSTAGGNVQAAVTAQVFDGGIPWDSPNRYVFVFTAEPYSTQTVSTNGVTIMTIGLGELTISGIFQAITNEVTCS